MNSIEEKKNQTTHEAQFDKRIEATKLQIEQIKQGIEIKKTPGRNQLLPPQRYQKFLHRRSNKIL